MGVIYNCEGKVMLFYKLIFYCSETLLTGEPSSRVNVGASPGRKLVPSLAGSEQLTHWTSETVLE